MHSILFNGERTFFDLQKIAAKMSLHHLVFSSISCTAIVAVLSVDVGTTWQGQPVHPMLWSQAYCGKTAKTHCWASVYIKAFIVTKGNLCSIVNNIGWITTGCTVHLNTPQSMNPTDFDDPTACPIAPASGQTVNFEHNTRSPMSHLKEQFNLLAACHNCVPKINKSARRFSQVL